MFYEGSGTHHNSVSFAFSKALNARSCLSVSQSVCLSVCLSKVCIYDESTIDMNVDMNSDRSLQKRHMIHDFFVSMDRV